MATVERDKAVAVAERQKQIAVAEQETARAKAEEGALLAAGRTRKGEPAGHHRHAAGRGRPRGE